MELVVFLSLKMDPYVLFKHTRGVGITVHITLFT